MPGFSSFADFNAEMLAGKIGRSGYSKVGVTGHAGAWQSLWRIGGLPAAGADGAAGSGTPGAGGTALTSAAGGIDFPNVSTDIRILANILAAATQNATLMIYDRLTHTSGISVATATSVNVGSPTLPRYNSTTSTDPDYIGGNECWLEVTTATTTTPPQVNLLTYTDQSGGTGNVGTTIIFPAAATVANTLIGPMPLALGDSGVRSVETVNVSVAAAAGVVQVVILRPLAYIPLIANMPNDMNTVLQMLSMPRLFDGHTLALALLMPATTATTIWGEILAVYG